MNKQKVVPYASKFSAFATTCGVCIGFMFFISHSAAKADVTVSLPTYRIGVTFVYSNGKSETVEAVRDDQVVWRDNRNRISTGSRDFTLRRLQWETKTRRGTRQHRPRGDQRGQAARTYLWPLSVGNKASYIETGRWQKKKGEWRNSEVRWRSEVLGRERIRTLAGEFNTWKITAYRYSEGKVYGRPPRKKEIRTWYYAPEVGHYVRYEKDYLGRKPNSSIDLVAVRPSDNHLEAQLRSVIADNFQAALENTRGGNKLKWQSPEQSAYGMTQPINTFRGVDKRDCRNYVQKIKIENDNYTYYGMACRNDDGQWEIPGL